jgi:hypothetical protein
MQFPLKAAIASALLTWTAPALAQGVPAPPAQDDAAKQIKQEEAERQLLVSMFAIRDYCKEAKPDRAKDIDANWTKSTADVPAPLIAFSKTPDFAGMVEARFKSLHTGSTNPDYATQLKDTCEKMLQ